MFFLNGLNYLILNQFKMYLWIEFISDSSASNWHPTPHDINSWKESFKEIHQKVTHDLIDKPLIDQLAKTAAVSGNTLAWPIRAEHL